MSSLVDSVLISRPRLKAVVALAPAFGAEIALLHGGMRTDISIEVGGVHVFAKLLSLLSGLWTTPEVARLAGLPLADVESTVEVLRTAGLLFDHAGSDLGDSLAPNEAQKLGESFFRAIRLDYRRHPLFFELAANERLFLGCAYEYWFLLRDAKVHIGLAIAGADEDLKSLLVAHREEERGHADQIAPHLAQALNVSVSALEASKPCSAGDAAIMKTRDLARGHLLGYLAATSFCEAPLGANIELTKVSESWSPSSKSLLAALERHFDEDQTAEHASLYSKAIGSFNELPTRSDVARALEAAHLYKHYLDNLNHEILRTYRIYGSTLPRVAACFNDFVTF